MGIASRRDWLRRLLAILAGIVTCSVLLKLNGCFVILIKHLLGGSACSHMVLSLGVYLPASAFLGGVVSGFFSQVAPSAGLKVVPLLLMTPGVYIAGAYVLMGKLHWSQHILTSWIWAAMFAMASFVGTSVGYNLASRRKNARTTGSSPTMGADV